MSGRTGVSAVTRLNLQGGGHAEAGGGASCVECFPARRRHAPVRGIPLSFSIFCSSIYFVVVSMHTYSFDSVEYYCYCRVAQILSASSSPGVQHADTELILSSVIRYDCFSVAPIGLGNLLVLDCAEASAHVVAQLPCVHLTALLD